MKGAGSYFLHPQHLADLRKSGLSDEIIRAAGIRSVPPRDIPKKLNGGSDKNVSSAYEIPYTQHGFSRLRVFGDRINGTNKYKQPKSQEICLYVHEPIRPALNDHNVPLFIVEGEKKCLRAIQEGLCAVAIGGLTSWGREGKLLPQFDEIPLDGRDVRIVPDNDWRSREFGKRYGRWRTTGIEQIERFSRALMKRGARVKVVLLPKAHEKIGLDDFLLNNPVEALDSLECVDSEEIRGEQDAASIISMFNEKHAVVMLGGKCTVLTEIINPVFDRPDITFSSVADFRKFYAPMKIQVSDGNGGTKPASAAKRWIEDPNRRNYEGVVFAPQRDVPGYYNLWRGFAVEPEPGDWSLLRQHIVTDFCHENTEHFNYLMAVCADAVQNPGGQRPGVAIVLRGAKGTGKGLFATSMGQIFGSHFLHLSNSQHLTGRFNAHLKDALWVFADEAFWAGDKASEGILKHMITEDYWTVEQKGKDPYTVKNHVGLVISSNECWVVPAGLQERRFFVLDVAETHARDTSYFGPIFRQMRDGGLEAMLYDLLSWNISGVDLRTAPETEALFEQTIQGMTTIQKWWFEVLRAGTQLRDGDDWKMSVETRKLHEDYLRFAADHGDRFPETDAVFSRELKKLEPGLSFCRLRIDGIRRHCVTFPDLEECRMRFKEMAGLGCAFDDDEDGDPG